LNLPFFIYKKLRSSDSKVNVSSRIIKIAIISVFLGIFVSLSAISIGKGLQVAIKDKIYSISPDIEITSYDNVTRGIATGRILDVDNVIKEIKSNFPNIKTNYSIEKPTLISSNGVIESIVFRGVTSIYDLNKFILNNQSLNDISENEIIISKSISNKFNISEGQYVNLYFQNGPSQMIPNIRSYKVVAIFKTDYPDFDNNFLIGSSISLQNVFNWNDNEFSKIEIHLDDKSTIPFMKKSLGSIESIQNRNLNIQTADSKYNNIFNWVSIFDFNIIIITILMILVAVISVIISLFILIFERVKMIGIMTSLGANNKSVSLIFFYQGIEIILKGLIPANILFLLISSIQNNFKLIKLNPIDYYIDSIPFFIDIKYIVTLNLIFFFVTLIILTVTFASTNNYTPSRNIKS
tara:strand:- start:5755 stop:6978 length:1224 start_codon:yes stop_codon:yes gene_type:complete